MSDHFGSIPIQPGTPKPPVPERPSAPQHPKKPIRLKKQRGLSGKAIGLVLAIALVVLAGAYTLAGYWFVPRYLHTALPALIQQQTGLVLTLGRVQFSPYTFDLRINDITVSDPADDTEPLLTLQSFFADIKPLPLVKGEIISTGMALNTFQLHLIRNSEGKYNFFSRNRAGGGPQSIAALDLSSLPFRFSLNNISLSEGNLTFHDKPNNNIHVVKDIQLSLPTLSNFTFQAKEYIHPSFSAVINGSPIKLTGQAALSGNSKDTDVSLKTELSCNFNAIDLNRYFDYLPFKLPFDLSNGKAEGSLKLTFAQSGRDNMLSVDFSMQAAEVVLNSADESFSLEVPSVKLEGAIQPLTGNTHLKSLELREPSARISKTFSFAHFRSLASLAAAKNQESGQAAIAPEVKIDLFLADNGRIVLTGDTPEKIHDQWEALQFTLKNYHNSGKNGTPDTQATFRLSGEQSNTRATFNLQGHIDQHLLPSGDLLITNIAASQLLPLLGLGDVAAQNGTADVQAYLSFKDYPDLDIVSRIAVAEGIFTFNDLALIENKHVWFSSPAIKIAGFHKEGRKISLGSVYLKNSTMDLHTDNLPAIAKRIGGEEGNFSVGALEFSGKLTLSDTAKKLPPLAFTDVSLQAINLARLESSSERDNLTFTARLGKSGEIQAKGKVRLSSFITTLTTGFTGISSQQLLPWFGTSELIDDGSVTLAGKGSFSFPFVSYSGQLLLQNGVLAKKDKNKKEIPYFSWQEINLQDFRYNSSPLHIGASQCTIVAPRLQWAATKDSPHLASALGGFLQKHFQAPADQKKNAKNLPVLEVKKVALTAGAINYSDSRLTPTWKGEIGGLLATIDNVSSDPAAEPSPFTLRGDFDAVAFTANGTVHLFNPAKQGSAEFTVNDFPLAAYKEALKKQVEIDASQGTFSATDKTTWGNGILSRSSKLVFSGIEPLSPKSETALTLALLTGQDATFTLSVDNEQPFSNSPKPLLTDAVAAFQKLTLKSAVSPLLLATGDYADLIGQEYAEFEPGKILLTGKGQESLARFKNLLAAHPGIGITVTGSVDAAIDAEAMKRDLEIAEEERVSAENMRRSEALQKATEEFLLQAAEKQKAAGKSGAIVEQQIPKEIYRRYAPIKAEKVVIDRSMLQELAQERARVVAELFIESLELPPERVAVAKKVVTNSDKEAVGNRVLFTIGTYNKPQGQ